LSGLRGAATGLAAAERVTRVDSTYSGARRADLPDAVISWNLAARIVDTVETRGYGAIRGQAGHATSPYYTGNHRATAFAATRAAGWQGADAAADPHVLDIAPTMLALLGVDPPGNYEGKSWYAGRPGAH
jgi:predicted AlkP superfamily phosphohydrolase/phosphomutase